MSIPILFEENATDFSTNGIGRLADAVDVKVKEKINGEYELEMEYPIEGTFFNELKINRIIASPVSGEAKVQPFQIYEISEPINGKVTVYAEHISYRLKFMIVAPFQAIGTPEQVWAKLKENALTDIPFNLKSDLPSTNWVVVDKPTSVKEILQGTEGSFLDQFGGEFEWDGWTIRLHKHRGQDNDYSIRYGSNLTDLTRQTDNQEAYAGIVPYITEKQDDGTTTARMLPERKLMGKYAENYPYTKLKAVDLTSKFKTDKDTKVTEDQLRDEAKKYISTNQIGKDKISLDIKFVNLADTVEYKKLNQRNIAIGDLVHVTEDKLNLNLVEEVTEVEWDALRDKYKELHLGDPKQTLVTQLRTEELDKDKQFSEVTDRQDKDYDTWLAQIQSIEKKHDKLSEGLNQERQDRVEALEKEGLTREEAIKAEREERIKALEQEGMDREQAIAAEKAEREKAIEAEKEARQAAINKLRDDLSQDYNTKIGLTSDDLKKHFDEQLSEIDKDFTDELRKKVGEDNFNKAIEGIQKDFEKAQEEVDKKWTQQVETINSDIENINKTMSSDTTGRIQLIKDPNDPTAINQIIIQNDNGSSFQANGNGLVYRDKWGNITTAFTADGYVSGSILDGVVVNSMVLNSAAISAGSIEGGSISGTAITGGTISGTNIYGTTITGGTIIGGKIYGALDFYSSDGSSQAVHIGGESRNGLSPAYGGEALFVTSDDYTSMMSSGQFAVKDNNGNKVEIHPTIMMVNGNTVLHAGNWEHHTKETIKGWVKDWVRDTLAIDGWQYNLLTGIDSSWSKRKV